MKKTVSFIFLILSLSSCLKTRSEVSESEQSQVYGKKNASNQNAQHESQLNQKGVTAAPVDERDELIRALNGRVENLENQIATQNSALQKEKSANAAQESQKIQLLQEALAKMEAQIQKLEAEQAQKAALQAAAAATKSSDEVEAKLSKKGSKEKATNTYELAQGFFANKEWKKAILNYQKYVDNFPKGKEVADSKYKIGVCFQELGMKEESMAFYEEVIANFGKSEAGKKAKIRLAKLKK